MGPAEAWNLEAEKRRTRWAPHLESEQLRTAIAGLGVIPPDTSGGIWEPIGSGIRGDSHASHASGRVTKISWAYDPDSGLTVPWVGTVGGGLWKLDPPHWRWVPVSKTLPGSPSVGAFAVHPTDSNQIVIGTGDAGRYAGTGLYRTTNGGGLWEDVGLPQPPTWFSAVRYHRTDPTVILAAASNGIWRYTEASGNWTQVYTGPPVTDLEQDPVTSRFWIAGVAGLGIIESDDDGETFHPITEAYGDGLRQPLDRVFLAIHQSDPRYIYALVTGDRRCNTGLLLCSNDSDCPGAENLCRYSTSYLNGIYRSSFYGYDAWTPILEDPDVVSWGYTGWYTGDIAVDPDNPARVFAGLGNVFWSENATSPSPCWRGGAYLPDGSPPPVACSGSTTFDAFSLGHEDFTSFSFKPDVLEPGNTLVLWGNDGGIYSYDYATNYTDATANLLGLHAAQAFAVEGTLSRSGGDPDLLLAGLQDNSVVRIDVDAWDLFKTWGGDGAKVSISPDDNDEWFASLGGRYAWDPGTLKWANIGCGIPAQRAAPMSVDPVPGVFNPQVYTGGGDFVWQKNTTTACGGWAKTQPTAFPETITIVEKGTRVSGRLLYASGGGTQLYVVDELMPAQDWWNRSPPLAPGTSGAANVVADRSLLQPETVYYTTSFARPSQAFLSTDGGLSWENVTGNIETLVPNANLYELVGWPTNLNILFMATNVGIFHSNDRGATWSSYMNGLPAVTGLSNVDLSYDNDANPRLRISTYGQGFWQRVIDTSIFVDGFESGDTSRW